MYKDKPKSLIAFCVLYMHLGTHLFYEARIYGKLVIQKVETLRPNCISKSIILTCIIFLAPKSRIHIYGLCELGPFCDQEDMMKPPFEVLPLPYKRSILGSRIKIQNTELPLSFNSSY